MTRFFVLSLVLLSASRIDAAPVPPEFQGDWVLAAAACTAPLRARIDVAKLTLINGADMESFGGVEMASGFFPPDYTGIQQVVLTEVDTGDQPVTATFNYQEKKGVALIELMSPQPFRRPNPAMEKLNARFAKLDLVKRFPLHKLPLKRCAAAARGR
jgi:hypothetical protein